MVRVDSQSAPALGAVVQQREPQRQATDHGPLVVRRPRFGPLGGILPTELELRLVERPAAVVRALERLGPLRDLVETLELNVVAHVHLTDIHAFNDGTGERLPSSGFRLFAAGGPLDLQQGVVVAFCLECGVTAPEAEQPLGPQQVGDGEQVDDQGADAQPG